MQIIKKIIAFLVLMYSANGFCMTGNELYSLMNSNRAAAVRYIQGLADMQGYIYFSDKRLAEKNNSKFNAAQYVCPPEGVTYGQMHDILKKYLEDHVEERHENVANAFYGALLPVWRCAPE